MLTLRGLEGLKAFAPSDFLIGFCAAETFA